MLATPEIIRETSQATRAIELIPKWRGIPLYRDALKDESVSLAQLPIITKREMRDGFPLNFLPSSAALDDLVKADAVELEYTSGTSEDRLPVLFGRGWWNEQELRALRLNSFVTSVLDEHPQARRATLTPPACNGQTCPTVWASRAARTFGNTLFLNLARIPFVLTETELQRMADEVLEWAPQFLDLDPVHGVWFAQFCERRGIRFPSVKFVLASYEFVSVVHRRLLQRAFGVPVFNLYGSTETGHLLMENTTGEMKASQDTAWLQVTETDGNEVGVLLVTTLSNDYMPLLRYRIGDLAQRIEQPYGTNYLVHGRIRDALTNAVGQRVTTWQVDQCFAVATGVAHYQLRPAEDGTFRLRYIPDQQEAQADLSCVVEKLEALLQSPVVVEAVKTLLPEASGKFRLTCP